MTDQQKYLEVLKELGGLLREKNDIISFKDYQIIDLEKRLEKAEQTIIEMKGNINDKQNCINGQADL